MHLGGKPIDAAKTYKVVGWAPVSEEARATGGEPAWEVVARHLRGKKSVSPRPLDLPVVRGVDRNPGIGS
jgi:sulfur-oxidizing protein SoxB